MRQKRVYYNMRLGEGETRQFRRPTCQGSKAMRLPKVRSEKPGEYGKDEATDVEPT